LERQMAAANLKAVDSAMDAGWKRTRTLAGFYKLALAAHDVLVALGASAAGAWLAEGGGWYAGTTVFQRAFLLATTLISIAFFTSFRLYRYHLIYSRRFHLSRLALAFGFSLLTLGTVVFTYTWARIIPPSWFIPVLVGLAFLLLCLNRFAEDKMIVLIKAFGLACVVVGLAGLTGPADDPIILRHIEALAVGLAIAVPSLTVSRFVLVHLAFNAVLRRRFRRQLLIVGSDREAERIADCIIRQNAPFWIVGTVSACGDCRLESAVPKQNLGRVDELDAVVSRNDLQEVVITDETIAKSELIELLDFFTARGMNAWFLPKLMPIIDLKLYLDDLCGIPMVRLEYRPYRFIFRRVKHALDTGLALLGLILSLPVFTVFALAIKFTSPGPVFYRAQAVGKGGRFFRMYKFRTMIADASKAPHKDYVTRMIRGKIAQDGSGKPLKIIDDPRVTKVGRILRKASLDELPQLINVLKGDMSLVGPRPCLPYEYEIYKDWHRKRTSVRPGISGLWQVVGRSEVSFEDMILLDLYYIYNRSLELDFSILFETIFVLLKKKGAY
jgi:exopolysaccharide biosynthesis polyprenyl glycosylphosphotransferase